MAKYLRTLSRWLRRALTVVCSSALAAIVILVFVQVVARYVTHTSTFEIAEICRILFIWLVFSGGALLIHDKTLITIDLLHGQLSERQMAVVSAVSDAVTAVFLGYFIWSATKLMAFTQHKIAIATGLSYWWFYTAPLCFCGIGLVFILERWVVHQGRSAHETENADGAIARGELKC